MAALSLSAPVASSLPIAGALRAERYWSPALGRMERVIVYTPPGYRTGTRRYPLALFLHGVPGTPEFMTGLGVPERIEALVRRGRIAPLVAAFPAGSDDPADDTEWADSQIDPSERWETAITRDLVSTLEARYRLVGTREARAVAGLSMGGYGAVNMALHRRGEFGVAESWSGYFNTNTPTVFVPGSPAWRHYSPQVYAPKLRPSLVTLHPRISIYVGDQDSFYAENVRFHRLLGRLGVPHRFVVVRGAGHSSSLWRSRIDASLAFIGDAFRAGGASG